MTRFLRWPSVDEEEPRSKHPVRDSALIYAVLAVLVVVFAAVTGGSLLRAIVVAVLVYAFATAWSVRRFRHRGDTGEKR